MIKPEILLTEFRQMISNLERRGEKLDYTFESLFHSFLIALKINNKLIIEILDREVTQFGTGAHIVIPQKHLGKKAIIILTHNQGLKRK